MFSFEQCILQLSKSSTPASYTEPSGLANQGFGTELKQILKN